MPLVTTTVELYLGVTLGWVDITGYVYIRDGIRITRGRADESSSSAPAECRLTLNNRDGRFSPRNPMGPYYGLFGRNTPIRMSADISGTPSTRFYGEVPTWPPSWDYSESDVWVPIAAAGVRRRLGSGRQKPILDVMTRIGQQAGATLGYWPMSDPDGAVSFAAAAGNAAPLVPAGSVAYAANTAAFPDLPALPTFAAASVSTPIVGAIAQVAQVGAIVWVPSGLGGLTHSLLLITFTAGGVGYAELGLLANTGQLTLSLYTSAGAFITGASTGVVDDIRNRAVRLQIAVRQNGTAVDMELAVTAPGGATTTYTDSIAATTLGTMSAVAIGSITIPGRTVLTGVSIGQLVVSDVVTVASNWSDPLDLYDGETADDRIFRLCHEEGVGWANGGPSTFGSGVAMGPQLPGALLDLLDEAAEADGGVLAEQVDDLGLVYTCRVDLYDQAAAASLSYSGEQLDEFEPTEDDQNTVNDLTVTRVGGSIARYEQTSGPLSTADPPEGVGRYADAVELSLESDSQLPDQAAWRVRLGTVDEARYPAIGFDLTASGEFTTGEMDDVLALREGNMVTVAGPPAFAGAPDDIRALVLGWREEIGSHTYRVVLITRPAAGFDVGVYDDTGASLALEPGSRYSPSNTTTSEALDTTETGIDYTGDTWITTASHPTQFPFDIGIGGERMRVTAATGTTFTVLRSRNGVVKSHLTGAPIELWQPARYGL